ncbi:phospholipase A2, partial [Archangium sp.]|uniref:phospholipase A2 n=1 Tax=Archangium sp. TaxID=1872627 RepID=UPI002EDBB41B
MHKRLFGIVTAILAVAVFLSTQPAGAAASYSREQLKARADVIAFNVSLPKFMSIYSHSKSGIDTRFNWSGYDGCSLPREIKPIASRWDKLFTNACYRHDFGYRNYGNGLALASDQTYKDKIDSEFLRNMRYTCAKRVATSDRGNC